MKAVREREGRVEGLKEHLVEIQAGPALLEGALVLPRQAQGLVLFAHGSGSSRLSPRNQLVASDLNKAGLGTLLLDLLTQEEEAEDLASRRFRFDVDLLSRRVTAATRWVQGHRLLRCLPLAYFGASTGAAAALRAAAELPGEVTAVVSRGGRPDLAGEGPLASVKAATLLLVGGRDLEVLSLNEVAMEHLTCEKKLVVVPGATHLFEEPGTLEEAAALATEWFLKHFKK